MAGFKTFWILLFTLTILASCVPQIKQTDCSENEAFNASLRTCVPVVGGPNSFINIDSFLPTTTISKYKNDVSPVLLKVTITNPFGLNYNVQWKRIYMGNSYSFNDCSSGVGCVINSGLSSYINFVPITQSTNLGTHIFTATVKDSTGAVVDEHAFEISINDTPKPVINTATINPSSYDATYTPNDVDQTYGFTINNNGATIAGVGYHTEWKLYKNGVYQSIYDATNPFTDQTLSGTNTAQYVFSPSTMEVATYLIIARIKNTAQDVFDEKQWAIVVKHPDLPKITSRNIFQGYSNPTYDTTSIAYNGIAYNSSTSYNFTVDNFTNLGQGDYCVTVANGDGSYPNDGQNIRVDYYLDGGTLIYSGLTTDSIHSVCLSDATAAEQNLFVFSNTTLYTEQPHSLMARVVDEATEQEYKTSDMSPSLGTYPVIWNFSVKPVNAPPTVSFTTQILNNITCNTSTSNMYQKNCNVTQDSNFTVGVHATDDFYDTSSTDDNQQNKFTYSMSLMRNGQTLSTCSKSVSNTTDNGSASGNDDYVGPDYLCTFTVPSYDSNGPVDPAANAYSVVITFGDTGSPITGSTPATSETLTYNLTVNEANTAPVISAQGSGSILKDGSNATVNTSTSISEGDTLKFNIEVSDAERDDHWIYIYKCDNSSCSGTTTLIASQFVNKSDNTLATFTEVTKYLEEDFIPITSVDEDVYFQVDVSDCPSILTDAAQALVCQISPYPSSYTATPILSAAPQIMSVNVVNYNPAPTFGGTPSPDTTTTMTAIVGFPITIYPGTVQDLSAVPSEGQINYQWYIDTSGTGNSFVDIDEATNQILRWTPSNGITPGTTVKLAVCADDGSILNPQPTASTLSNNANCKKSWDVVVMPNVVATNYYSSTSDIQDDVAIWQDTTNSGADKKVIYTAYSDSLGQIYIDKTVFDSNGVIYNNDTTGFRSVVFDAVPDGTQSPSTIKDISLTGTDTHLYIAYQAATTANPNSPRIRVRRIDKRYGSNNGSKTSYPHPGKFGFTYDNPLDLDSLWPTYTDTGVNITQSGGLGNPILVEFVSSLSQTVGVSQNELVTNTISMFVQDGPNDDQLCSGSTSGCTLAGNATRYANFINNSGDRLLQGVSADASGSQVYVYGSLSGSEYLDSHSTLSSYVTGKLGNIMISGGKWYLPFVDYSTGATLSYIRLLSGNAGATDTLNSSHTVASSTYFAAIGKVNYFTNALVPDSANGDKIIIASATNTNIAQLHILATDGTVADSSSLYNSAPVIANSIRLGAPSATNGKYFVTAKVLESLPSTYEWAITRCTANLASCNPNFLETIAFNSASLNVLSTADIKDITIEASPSNVDEARLLVSSTNGGIPTNLYSVRYSYDNKLSCGLCTPINLLGNSTPEFLSPSGRIATTRIDQDMTIGTGGSNTYSPSENTKDVFFSVYATKSDSGSGTDIFKPQMGIFNAEIELIDSITTDSSGLLGHRPAFFSDNQ